MLEEIARLFFKLGCVGFGGPTAHIALMEEQCVKQRQWLSAERFSEGLAVCNLLPGPTSSQMAIWLGYVRGRLAGALVSGLSFILPAFVLLLGLSWAYFRYGALPRMQGAFAGISPAVLAIILATCWRLGKTAIKDAWAALVLIAALALTVRHVEIALTLIGAGLLGIARARLLPVSPPKTANIFLAPLLAVGLDGKLLRLALFFLKVGALLFGGGLVLIPFIQREVVDSRHWLTTKQFFDGVALGQITPGPVVITATFIGYKVAGWTGAVLATTAIFLPSFVFILLAAPQLERVRKFAVAQAFLKGVTPAVVGAILSACIPLARAILNATPSFRLWFPVAIFVLCLLALTRTKLGTPWIVLAAGLAGLLLA